MEMTPVASSNIQAVGYDPGHKVMHVEFKGGQVYEYSSVPPATHKGLIESVSPGSYFATVIKPDFRGRKI